MWRNENQDIVRFFNELGIELNRLGSQIRENELLELIGWRIQEVLENQNLFILLQDKHKGFLKFTLAIHEGRYLDSLDKEKERELFKIIGKEMIQKVFKDGIDIVFNTREEILKEFPTLDNNNIIGLGFPESWLGIPLWIRNKISGVLITYDCEQEHAFDLEDKDILDTIANQVAIAIDNVRLNNQLRVISDKFETDEKIIRSIEFSPEYKQAGLSILSYFGTILHQKYTGIKAKVRIEQDDLKVKMVIETEDGRKDEIQETLYQYGLVVTGRMPPDEFLPDPLHIMELKNQLRIAKFQLDSKQELIDYAHQNVKYLQSQVQRQQLQIQKLTKLISEALQSKLPSLKPPNSFSKDELMEQYELLHSKIHYLRCEYIKETDSGVKFKLKAQIQENEIQLSEIERKLEA